MHRTWIDVSGQDIIHHVPEVMSARISSQWQKNGKHNPRIYKERKNQGTTGWSVSPYSSARSWTRSPWNACEGSWNIRMWLVPADVASLTSLSNLMAFHNGVMALFHKGRRNAAIYLDLCKDLTLSRITPFSLNWRSIYMMDLLGMDMGVELEGGWHSKICG